MRISEKDPKKRDGKTGDKTLGRNLLTVNLRGRKIKRELTIS